MKIVRVLLAHSRYELKFGLKLKETESVKELQHDNLNFHIQS